MMHPVFPIRPALLFTAVILLSSIADPERAYPQQDDPSPVAYYPFDGGTGDASENSNDGFITNNVTFIDGVDGEAAKFGGFGDRGYITVPDDPSLTFEGEASFSMWARLDDSYGQDDYCDGAGEDYANQRMLAKSGDRYGFILDTKVNQEGYVYLRNKISDATISNNGIAGTSVETEVDEGDWFHVVHVMNESGTYIYVDGELISQDDRAAEFSVANDEDMFIGIQKGKGSCLPYWYPLNGALDEVRVYDQSLTEAEIQELYESGISSGESVKITDVHVKSEDESSFSRYTPSEVVGVRSGVKMRFEGIVTDTDGNPAVNQQVDVYNSLKYAPDEGDNGVRSVTTGSDGTFRYPSADEDPLSTAPLAAGVRPFWFNVRGTEEAVPFAVYVHSEEGTLENINQMLADEAAESGTIASMRVDTSASNPFSDLSIRGKPYPPDDTDLGSSANDEFFRYYYAVYAGPTERNFLLSDDQSSGWLRRGFELHKGKVQQVLQNLPERFEDRLPPPGAFGNGSQSVLRSSGAKTSLGLDLGYWSNVASWTGKTAACGAGVAGAIGSGGIGTGGAIAFCTPLVGALQNEGFEALVNNSGFAKNIFCPGNQSVEGCTRRFAAGTFIAELGVGQFSNPKSLEVANRVLEASGAIRDIQEITGFDGSELIRDSQDRIRGLRGSTNKAFGDADLQLGVTSPRRPALEFSTVQFDDPESPSTLNVEVGSNRAIYEEGTTAQSTPAVQIEESSFSTTSLEEDENFQYQAEIPVSKLPGYSGDPSTWDKTIRAEGTSFETLRGTGVGGFCGISAKTFPLGSSQTNDLSKGPLSQGPKKTKSSTLSDTKLDVPADAFGGNTSFVDFTRTSYSQVSRADQPALRPRSPVVQVKTDRALTNPATLTLGLDLEDGDTGNLNLYWRGESSAWQQVDAEINRSGSTATAEVSLSGYYAVLEGGGTQPPTELPVQVQLTFPTDGADGVPETARLSWQNVDKAA
jgi:hypothetical protein